MGGLSRRYNVHARAGCAHHLQREVGHALASPRRASRPPAGAMCRPRRSCRPSRERSRLASLMWNSPAVDAFFQQPDSVRSNFLREPVDLGKRRGFQVLLLAEDRSRCWAGADNTTWVKSTIARAAARWAPRGSRRRDGSVQRQLDGRLADRGQQIGLAAEMRVDERLGDAEFGAMSSSVVPVKPRS